MNLGNHYIALNVKDIKVSKAFYEKLGFTHNPNYGSIEDRWVMMINNDIMIGLYQDMIPKNTLTFNPDDVRSIQKELKAQNVEMKIEPDESPEGPAFILLQDPDGNPILFDQVS